MILDSCNLDRSVYEACSSCLVLEHGSLCTERLSPCGCASPCGCDVLLSGETLMSASTAIDELREIPLGSRSCLERPCAVPIGWSRRPISPMRSVQSPAPKSSCSLPACTIRRRCRSESRSLCRGAPPPKPRRSESGSLCKPPTGAAPTL